MYLKLEARTRPGRPAPPRELRETDASLSGEGSTRQLQWLAPYPPRGILEYYTLRWREDNSTAWQHRDDVFPSAGADLCGGRRNDPQGDGDGHAHERRACHSVSGLVPGRDYVFQVGAEEGGVVVFAHAHIRELRSVGGRFAR